MQLFNFNWRVGRAWGIAHPDHICWNSEESVCMLENKLYLGIDKMPTIINGKEYKYSVGYVSSIDTIKYGYIKTTFTLPKGTNLWPAIWLTDAKTWPPEIDIMEAWSNHYCWPLFKPKSIESIYKKNPFANCIFPSVHLGTSVAEHQMKTYKKLGGTPICYLNPNNVNTCELEWTENCILIKYNSHTMAYIKDRKILKHFNNSSGMEIHLNNYVTNDFNDTDYQDFEKEGFQKNFIIHDLVYQKL